MLQVVCPTCSVKLRVRDDLIGKRINCGGCGSVFSIATRAEQVVVPTQIVSSPSQSAQPQISQSNARPVIRTHSDSYRAKLRRPSLLTRVAILAVQLGITCGTLYAGYYFLTMRVTVQPSAQVAHVSKPKRVRSPAPKIDVVPELSQVQPRIVPRDIEPKLRATPLPVLPSYIDLPAVGDTRITTLIEDIKDAEIVLVSLSANLKHEGKKLTWKDSKNGDKTSVFAGLTEKDEKVHFRWLGDVPEEAESALRNSVIKVIHDGDERILALRQPQIVEPYEISLKRNVQRIVAKIDHLPPRDAIRADFTGINLFPYHRMEEGSTKGMKLKDVATIWYRGAYAAATKITLKKMGQTVVLELDSRYKLPSGDEEPMSIPKGSRKRKQIEKLIDRANTALRSLSDLDSHLNRLRGELHVLRVHTPDVIRQPGVVVDRSILINQEIEGVLFKIRATEAEISEAKRLISQGPAIRQELDDLNRVAQIAGALDGTKGITYRFYIVVAAHEVDLLIAE